MAIKKRTNKSVKSGNSETYNALRLKWELIEVPRSILDEKDQRTALSVGRDAIRVDGSVTVTGVEEGVYETDQILVLDGDRIKKRTASQISDELGDVQSIVYVTDDLSSITDSGGTADFFILGGNGVTTTTETKTVRISGVNATTSLKGVVELATTAETTTGTDTARAVTPDGLKDGYEGSTNVDTLGEVTTGSWEADEIANDYIADLPTSKITSGTMADARIYSSNVKKHQGDITGTWALNSGSITSGFGSIDNGSSTIGGGIITGTTLRSTGTILSTSPTLTTSGSDDYSISSTQTLNQGLPAVGVQTYRQIKTNLTDTASGGWDAVYLIDQQVGGTSKFKVDKSGNATFAGTVTSDNGVSGRFQVMGQYEVYGRYSSVNTWYVGNQSFGTSITEGDWGGGFKMNYAQFTAVSDVKLLGWKFIGSFSSTVDWEMEVWHTETDSDGNSDPSAANKVGSTQSVSPTATRLYTLGETGLTYDIPAGDQLYVLTRYTSGSGTKNSYGTVGFEFNNA